jgi:TonB family protein
VVPAPEAAAGSAQLFDLTYYGARQLDVYPMLTGALELRHPGATEAKARVLLLVLIDAAGIVDDASVVESVAPGQWDETARRALMTARFKPALRSGRPVKSRLLIEIDYGTAGGAQ